MEVSPISSEALLTHLRGIEETMPDVFSETDAQQIQDLEHKLGLEIGEPITGGQA